MHATVRKATNTTEKTRPADVEISPASNTALQQSPAWARAFAILGARATASRNQEQTISSYRPMRPLLQRASLKGCQKTKQGMTADDQKLVKQAVKGAERDLEAALAEFPQTNDLTQFQQEVSPAVKAALWLAFRSESAATALMARTRLRILRENQAKTSYVCLYPADNEYKTSGCGAKQQDTIAFAPLGEGSVFLCMDRFVNQKTNPVLQSQTILHEWAHAYLRLHTKPEKYLGEQCQESAGTAGMDPILRFETADTLNCLVYFLTHEKREAMKDRSAEHRGAKLSLKQSPSGPIFLLTEVDPTQVPKTEFQVEGVPAHSGFGFQWKLRNGVDFRLNQGWADSPKITLPSTVSEHLRKKGAKNGTLLCRVRFYDPTPRDRPPNVKWLFGEYQIPSPTIILSQKVSFVNERDPRNAFERSLDLEAGSGF